MKKSMIGLTLSLAVLFNLQIPPIAKAQEYPSENQIQKVSTLETQVSDESIRLFLLFIVDYALLESECKRSVTLPVLDSVIRSVPVISMVYLGIRSGVTFYFIHPDEYFYGKNHAEVWPGIFLGQIGSIVSDLIYELGDVAVQGVQALRDYLKDGKLDRNEFHDLGPFLSVSRAQWEDTKDTFVQFFDQNSRCGKAAQTAHDSLGLFINSL